MFCYLVVDGQRIQVCQRKAVKLFEVDRKKREKSLEAERVRVNNEEQDFFKTLPLYFPTVPSDYCRLSSSKMYLEPIYIHQLPLYTV